MAAGTTQTFTGKASDAMCGAKHTEGLTPADCVRAYVQKGAKYALVVGDKVYTLDTSDQATLDTLNKLAWEQAKVTGTANGTTISVKSVTVPRGRGEGTFTDAAHPPSPIRRCPPRIDPNPSLLVRMAVLILAGSLFVGTPVFRIVPLRAPDHRDLLRTDGIYSVVRHPLMLCDIFGTLGGP